MQQNSTNIEAPQFTLKPRRPIGISAADLVKIEQTNAGSIPVTFQPVTSGVDLIAWAESERNRIQAVLLQYGAILFRGFEIGSASAFEKFILNVSGALLPYTERSSPRKLIAGHIYSSTEYPPEHAIFLHCENSYQKTWPLKIFFYCQLPAEHGGETPIADTRRIFQGIDPHVLDKFARLGVMYVRNFGMGPGLSWQIAFQTENPHAVEQYCSSAGINYTWINGNRLQTRQIRKAIQTHPVTGEPLWFNHAAFFHVSTLDSATMRVIQENLPEEDLPSNTYYGDGSPIEPETLDHIRAIYLKETFTFPWRRGDILLLDNMLTAHGRSPYRGLRKILVGMSEPYSA